MKAAYRRIQRIDRPDKRSQLPATLHPVIKRVYENRGVTSVGELDRTLRHLLPVNNLRGVNEAASLLHQAMATHGRILLLGDFDADGATSCALAVRALREMGASEVDYLVPNRFQYGYGLTPEIAQEALQRNPDLLITVDNGISSLRGVAAVRAKGVPVLITDHHLAGDKLPEADVIVNPNAPGDPFLSKHLAGVGVIFYVLAALRQHLRRIGWFGKKGLCEPNLARYLDLVALGTVADVAVLDRNNRILVHQGLQRIRAGKCSAGISALIAVSGRRQEQLSAADLGFAIGPRLNAAGRLDDMSVGIECLLTDDVDQAREIAARLDHLNKERRRIEQSMQEDALANMEEALPGGELPVGLCLYQPEWHQGVIGVLASRIRERFHRPVIVFANAEEHGVLKGSARSISGLHIRDTLDAIAANQPDLLEKFGGHAMAAGVSLRQVDYQRFCKAFDLEVRKRVQEQDLNGVIRSDGTLSAADFSLELAQLLDASGPWGQGFPEPVFDGVFELVSTRTVGQKHLKAVLRSGTGSALLDAIAFNQADQRPEIDGAKIHAAYRLKVNEFRNQRNLQLVIEGFRLIKSAQ